jgi:hypothetical protein
MDRETANDWRMVFAILTVLITLPLIAVFVLAVFG